MIQALSANAADEAFRERILPRTPRRGEHLLNAHSLNPSSKLAIRDATAGGHCFCKLQTWVRKLVHEHLYGPSLFIYARFIYAGLPGPAQGTSGGVKSRKVLLWGGSIHATND
jgi:hypothetical protein